MAPSGPLVPVELGDETFVRLDLEHPEVEEPILAEMRAGVEVYYDREWPFTRRFCRFLLEHAELLEGRDVLVVGAGLGMESVVAGHLGKRLWINDLAPAALELLRRQLRANGIGDVRVLPGSFAEIDLPPVDLIVACFVVYDPETRAATLRLADRAGGEGVPLLLGGRNVGGHLSALLEGVERPVRTLLGGAGDRIVLIGDSAGPSANRTVGRRA